MEKSIPPEPIPTEIPNPESRIPLPVHKGGNQPECKFVQGKPNCCKFKEFKGKRHGKDKEIVFICDIPLEERHKYIDAEQDINHPCMKSKGHAKNDLPDPIAELHKDSLAWRAVSTEQQKTIEALSKHLSEMTLQMNKLTEKLFSLDKVNGNLLSVAREGSGSLK